MLQAFLLILSFTLAFCIWTFIDTHHANANTVVVKHVDTLVYNPTIIKPPVQKAKPPEPPQEIAVAKPTIKNTVPVIAPDVKVIHMPPPVDSFAGVESGAVHNSGSKDGEIVAISTKLGNGKAKEVATPVVPVVYAEQMPEFNGDMYAYLVKSVRYPRAAVENGVEGRVIISFVVNEDGHISNAVVKRGIGAGCDEEGLRVVNGMPAWKPGRQNGRAVKVYYTLPINFKLR